MLARNILFFEKLLILRFRISFKLKKKLNIVNYLPINFLKLVKFCFVHQKLKKNLNSLKSKKPKECQSSMLNLVQDTQKVELKICEHSGAQNNKTVKM